MAAKQQFEQTIQWRTANKVDDVPVAGDGIIPCIYPVRGFKSMPDSNFEAAPGISDYVFRVCRYMGGSCLHKVDKEGCPVYIERLVSVWLAMGRVYRKERRREGEREGRGKEGGIGEERRMGEREMRGEYAHDHHAQFFISLAFNTSHLTLQLW